MKFGTVVGIIRHPRFMRLVLESTEREESVEVCGQHDILLGDHIWTQCGKAMWTCAGFDRTEKDVQLTIHRIDFEGKEMCKHEN